MLGWCDTLVPTFSYILIMRSIRDHVDWDEEQEQIAKEKVSVQLENPVPEEERGKRITDNYYQVPFN